MLPLGLSADQYRVFLTTLASSHRIKVTSQILTSEHDVVRTVSNVLMDGQVDVVAPKMSNGEVEVSRTAHLTFLDPGRTLALDSGSPADGAFYMDRMVRVVYSVRCPFGWVDVPVFTGPVIKVDRDGDFINVECHGKERYALASAWKTGTFRGRKGDVLMALMRRSGEISRYMDFPDTNTRVAKSISVGRESTIWSHVWKLNASMGRVLFYDGRGVCRSVKRPTKSALTVKTGKGATILSDPQISYSIDDLKNSARVQGGKPAKSKTAVVGTYQPAYNHPLSPSNLGRNGLPMHLAVFEENTNFKTTKAARARARDLVEDSIMQHVETTLDLVPIPHLEPWDIVHVLTDKISIRIRANAFSIPLTQPAGSGNPMTLGSTRDLRRPRRRIGKK